MVGIERGFPVQPIMPSDNAITQERNYYIKQMENLRRGFKIVIKTALTEAKIRLAKIVEQQFKKAVYVFNQETKKLFKQFKRMDIMLGKKDRDNKKILKQIVQTEQQIIGI
jgi:hypothetical protein